MEVCSSLTCELLLELTVASFCNALAYQVMLAAGPALATFIDT